MIRGEEVIAALTALDMCVPRRRSGGADAGRRTRCGRPEYIPMCEKVLSAVSEKAAGKRAKKKEHSLKFKVRARGGEGRRALADRCGAGQGVEPQHGRVRGAARGPRSPRPADVAP